MAVSYKKPEASKYQKEFAKYVKEQVIKQNWIISDNKYSHYYMDCVFYFPRTDMDANNVFKCLADAITDTGCVWIDDTQLCERVQGIYYDGKNPRIEITICPVDYIGIFNDISQLENFESNCIGCTRYKRNCSILKQAKEGRVQEEIIDGACKKYKKIKGE
ncbi:Endodeoxyribonuclease RusA [Lacrimispora sphenoides]|nr:Endodeoxyribonuclease RusA [Lacrimispora sphenoides]